MDLPLSYIQHSTFILLPWLILDTLWLVRDIEGLNILCFVLGWLSSKFSFLVSIRKNATILLTGRA